MIMRYVRLPSCLILAVTPANSDLTNSDALQMAGNADPDGRRTIGVITKLDIMDRGTDARDLLLGRVIPLQLGYVGVLNHSQEDIKLNRSIKDALAADERFFRSHPVYTSISDRCGIPQLARKLNQILGQHIKECLPALRSKISSQLVALTREYMSYREVPESKADQATLLINILSRYSDAFSFLVEGKSEEISTSELSGGARVHCIFRSIFVRSLEEVDPCDGLSNGDIQTTIQNARGPKSAVFVPEDGVESATMQASERSSNSRTFVRSTANGVIRSPANGVISDQGSRSNGEAERNRPMAASSIWGSIFSGTVGENHSSAHEVSRSKPQREHVYNVEHTLSVIHLREPPPILKSSEVPSEQEATEIAATKLLVSSYFDIVRKIIEDSVPKATMHLLVNHAKRELHNVLIQELYRENLFEDMLQEPGDMAVQRRHVRETLRVLRQAFQTLDALPLEAESIERG